MAFIAKDLKVNDQIRVRQVRLIDAEGTQVGIVDTRDAMQRARDADLDLVLVGERAQPPVARLMDYGKYRYELQQEAKEARKRSRQSELKAIKFRVKIGDHDYRTKVNHVRRFLSAGHKVKVTIMFRGRERTHPELGKELLQRVAQDVSDLAAVDQPPQIAGMDMNMTVRPIAADASAAKDDDAGATPKGAAKGNATQGDAAPAGDDGGAQAGAVGDASPEAAPTG